MLKISLSILITLLLFNVSAQVIINEASNRNFDQVYDEDNERNDWIELYNTSNTEVNLKGWTLSDRLNNLALWEFGDCNIEGKGFLLIHASGKDRKETGVNKHWESAILPSDEFSYIVPTAETPTSWKDLGFDDSLWEKGQAGFGFGDNDDNTIVPLNSVAVFIRRNFNISDTSAITDAILHVDYDDGFIAYLNGSVIVRANVNENAGWNTTADSNHEAQMYSGGKPEAFRINSEFLKSILIEGENTFAIQIHNISTSSTDLSLIPFLSFSLKEGHSFFKPTPDWFMQDSPQQLHTNFKISSNGETIYLSHNGNMVDSLAVPRLNTNHSIGRTNDGAAQIGLFTKTTPGKSNNKRTAYVDGYTALPFISPEAGYYDSPIEVKIYTTESNASIRYTLDGSEPTNNSTIYSSAITIKKTQTIRARSFVPGKIPGMASSSTFLIGEKYTLPVLSIATNNSNLYGNSGIFTNWQQTWNIPAHIEYFNKNKKLAFVQNAGMQVDGGAGGSRSLPQHSFRIEPGNGSLGDGDLKYNLMHRRPNRDNFPSFYLRNGSNQHNILTYKDGLQVNALARNTYTYYSAYEPIVVYINGEYFGVYELREKINYDYLEDNYQMNIDSLDFLGVSYFKGQQLEALRGSIDPFIKDLEYFRQLNNQASDYLTKVDQFLDIKSYTDYIIAESWAGNNDWPYNNIKLFRCVGTNMRWQWAINDLEWALNPNGWTSSSFNHIEYMLNQGSWNNYTGFWYNMIKNPEYRAYFLNRFADLMNTNYDFSVVGPLENEMFDEIFPEMNGQFKRWGSSNINTQMNNFSKNHETFRSELSIRSNYVRNHLQSQFNVSYKVNLTLDIEPQGAGTIQISTINPMVYPWKGIYFSNVPIEIKAIANPGYEFDNWDKNTFSNDVYNALLSGEFKKSKLTLKAVFKPSSEFNAGVVISEFNYKKGNNYNSPDWVELCNYGTDLVNLRDWYFTDDNPEHIFKFNNDLFLEPGQRVVVTSNNLMFNHFNPSVKVYNEEFSFGLGTPNDAIILYNPSNDIVFEVSYSDNFPWPLSSDFDGRTLEYRFTGSTPDDASAWFRGCVGGSPGTAYQYCDEPTVSAPLYALNSIDMKVFPNPASDQVNVELFLTEADKECIIKLFDTTGKLIYNEVLKNSKNEVYRLQIPILNSTSNLLFLSVSTNKAQRTTKILRVPQ